MMGCRDIVELLDDYLDGRLADEDARALEGHLRGCQDCTAFLATYRGTLRVTRALRERELPAQLRGRLLAFLRR